jgi:simple sugar transport system permease protein
MSTTTIASIVRRVGGPGRDLRSLLGVLLVVLVFFGIANDRFLSFSTFESVAYQLPELGLLALAELIPILTGGFNLAITVTANMSGLVMAWILQAGGGADAGAFAFALGVAGALATGALCGWVMGVVIAHTKAHPILVSLSMMIFLRGLGEFLTRGGDVSGFPGFVASIGHGSVLGIPAPLLILIGSVIAWNILLSRTRLGFNIYMIGSNIEATRYSGIDTRRVVRQAYMLSGLMCGVAGIVMLARFNSVRVGHGEAYLLITVLACFLGRVDPNGGFGRVLPVAVALVVLQIISSGLNLMGANQHLATAMWGGFLILVMLARWLAGRRLF